MTARENLNDKVLPYLQAKFAGNPWGLTLYWRLWERHAAAGLAGDHFVNELTSGSKTKFSQRVWEMLLGQHLIACGHDITTHPEGEPDYRFLLDNQVVWVEAISPTPGQELPLDWTTHVLPQVNKFEVQTFPHEEMLLRWTAAFKDKAGKCDEYRAKGVVKPADAFVIAIDGSQLAKMPVAHGISQVPFAVETVFPVGPLGMEIDPITKKLGKATHTVQTMVVNRNKAAVFKEPFLRKDRGGISAVLGCYGQVSATDLLPVQIAYNPHAASPLAPGHLGVDAEEWGAELKSITADGEEWSIYKM